MLSWHTWASFWSKIASGWYQQGPDYHWSKGAPGVLPQGSKEWVWMEAEQTGIQTSSRQADKHEDLHPAQTPDHTPTQHHFEIAVYWQQVRWCSGTQPR